MMSPTPLGCFLTLGLLSLNIMGVSLTPDSSCIHSARRSTANSISRREVQIWNEKSVSPRNLIHPLLESLPLQTPSLQVAFRGLP